jgi:hypothetical protein
MDVHVRALAPQAANHRAAHLMVPCPARQPSERTCSSAPRCAMRCNSALLLQAKVGLRALDRTQISGGRNTGGVACDYLTRPPARQAVQAERAVKDAVRWQQRLRARQSTMGEGVVMEEVDGDGECSLVDWARRQIAGELSSRPRRIRSSPSQFAWSD